MANVLLDFDIPWASVDGSWSGVLLEFICISYSFFGLAIVCDEHMVPSLDTLCERWGIGEDVAGATFMAFGSAAPEIIINVVATIQAQNSSPESTSLGVSAILGSGMIAFSLIPAACGIFADGDLLLKRRPLFRDQLFYTLSLCTLIYIIHDGAVHSWEAGLLVVVYFTYLIVIVSATRVRQWYWENVLNIPFVGKKRESKHGGSHDHVSINDEDSSKHQPLLTEENAKEEWRDTLRNSQFYDFILPFEQQEWDDPNLWLNIQTEDFDKMGINKRGRIAKFRRFLKESQKMGIYLQDNDKNDNNNNNKLEKQQHHDEEEGAFSNLFEKIISPLNFIFEWTCIDCQMGHKYESFYMLTFLAALFWVSVFSFVLSSIVERWVSVSGVPMVFFGLILVSFGAEVPDCIESVTVAKKGYGSMAVSNCQGTQVINICMGLGAPWLMTTLSGAPIVLMPTLIIPAMFQLFLCIMNIFILTGFTLCSGQTKSVLNKSKSYMLIGVYLITIAGYGIYLHHVGLM